MVPMALHFTTLIDDMLQTRVMCEEGAKTLFLEGLGVVFMIVG